VKNNGFLTATICFFSVLFIFFIPAAYGDELKKVALFPFDVYAEKDPASLRKQVVESIQNNLLKSRAVRVIPQDVLSKSLDGKQVDEKTALQAGREVGADVVIIGSVSQLGKVVSIDAKVLDVKSGQASQGVFVQGTLAEGIGNLAARLTEGLMLKVAAEKRIASIVVTGNRKIETSAVMNVLKEAPGKLFSPADLSADIKAIYKTGYFSDVKADVKDTPAGKVITFTVQERPVVSNVIIKGNDAIETKDIEAVLTVRLRQFLDVEKVKEDVEKIRTLYHNKGYFNVEIKHDIEKRSEREAVLTYTIVEGRRLYIKSISFRGVQAFSPKELKNMMDTNEYGFFHIFTDSGILKEDKLKEDAKKLNAFT
jgi:outer membrane protein insertion porin family